MKKIGKWILITFLIDLIIIIECFIFEGFKIEIFLRSVAVCFVFIGIISYQIMIELSRQYDDDFEINFSDNKINVKYRKKYEFTFEGNELDIQKIELEKDKNGKEVSLTDKAKIYNYFRYAYSKPIEDSQEENSLRNKFLLDNLNENCEGIRKATKSEKNKYIKIKILEFCVLVLMPIMLIVLNFIGLVIITNSIKVLSAIPILIVISLIFSTFIILKKVNELKGAIYLSIDCCICDGKTRYYGMGSRRHTVYKVRVKDKTELYIDKWWNCGFFTYESDEVKVVVAKLKNGKSDVKFLESSMFGK